MLAHINREEWAAMADDAGIIRAKEPGVTEVVEFHKPDPYVDWIDREGVLRIEEFAFDDLLAVELGEWKRKGGKGAIINIPYESLTNDTQLVEIDPGGNSEPEHHMYEEYIYVLSGRGAASIWIDEKQKHTFEWTAGSLFTIPLNASYQLFNGSGSEPARYMAVTNAPIMMRLFMNNDFIWNNPYMFPDRLTNDEGWASGGGQMYKGRVWETNFLPDAANMPMPKWGERGGGGTNIMLSLSDNTVSSHISEFQVGTYKKAHRHGPGAHLLITGGEGFALLWRNEDLSDLVMAPWQRGSLYLPTQDAENEYFHQHFNLGNKAARYFALHPPVQFIGKEEDEQGNAEGVNIEYSEEEPWIREYFESELAKRGLKSDMPEAAYQDPDYTFKAAPTAS